MTSNGAGSEDKRAPEEPHVVPTPFALLALCTAAGLIGGWALRPLTQRYAVSSPVITWLQVLAIFFVAVVLAAVAWSTRRTIARRHFLDPHRAVNRLVLAKACALVGALVGNALGDPQKWGLDAAAAGAFVALLWPRLKSRDAAATMVLAIAIALITSPLLPVGVPVILTVLAALFVGLSGHGRHERATTVEDS